MQLQVEYVRGRLATPPVVLLPGLFAGAWVWKPTWDHLTALGYSVLQVLEPFALIDPGSQGIEVLGQLLIDALEAHAIPRAILCGNSLGGLVALDLASRHAARVAATVVSGCPGLGETVNLGLNPRRAMSPDEAERIASLLFYDRSAIPDGTIEKSSCLAGDRRSAMNILRYASAIRKYDVRQCLPQVQCEVLLIWGEHDRIAPPDEWERNLRLIARPQWHKLARCGHSPMLEAPSRFNAILSSFLAQQP
jgi:pimeloyl-ACP methyl ester carboxylesterase